MLRIILVLTALHLLVLPASAEEEGADRPASLFKVSGDEWLALPEVFSKLDFTADNTFARADDLEGQLKLRSSRFWGRLYIDGWPQPIQFFRAHFGIEPPMGKKIFVFAEPRDACAELTNVGLTSDHVLMVKRGACTFGTKALNARRTPAAAIVVINNEPGLEHLPGPDAHDIDLAVVSIPQPEGLLLEVFYDAGPPQSGSLGRLLAGHLVPMNCEHSGATCMASTFEERDAIKLLAEGGTLTFHGSTLPPSELPVEYLLAHFGVKVPYANASYAVVMARPADACSPLTNAEDVKGKIVLVRRGGCPFVNKAEEIQSAGGVAVVVGSLHEYIVRMGVEPRWKGLNTAIPVMMVSKRAYGVLVAEAHSGGRVGFSENMAVTGAVWESLEKLVEGQGWPRSAAYAAKRYEEFLLEHRAWPDRLSSVNAAYKKLVKSTDAGAGAKGQSAGEL